MTPEHLYKLWRQEGGRITPQRRAVVETLAAAGGPRSAPELLETLQSAYPDLSADTVYRILDSCVRSGAAEVFHVPTRRADRYEWVDRPHHHCVCLGCGKVTCLPSCPVDQEREQQLLPTGFRTVRHEYQIFGYCGECQATTAAPPAPADGEPADVSHTVPVGCSPTALADTSPGASGPKSDTVDVKTHF